MKNSYSVKIKNTLENIIDEMSLHPEDFVKDPSKDFKRNRKLPFKELIRLMLCMRGNTLNKEIYDYFKDTNNIITKSAFIQQREKLLPEAMEYLFHKFNNSCKDKNTYDGYYLYAADGSALNIPLNKEAASYCDWSGEKGYNQLHLNAIYDVLNKVYVDCLIQPKPDFDEREALTQMINNRTFDKPTIMVADRGYGAYNLFETINRKENLDYVFRVRNEFSKEIKALPMKELDTIISFELRTTATKEDKELFEKGLAKKVRGPSPKGKEKQRVTWYFESPFQMSLRVVRFKISENNYETLVTSLNRFQFPIAKLKEIYHLRWGIETSFRELKYAIGLISFHSKKENFIIQEIYSRLIMYNFCERITKNTVIKQSKGNKYTYQVNFTMGIHICIDYFKSKRQIDVEGMISKYILPVREGKEDTRKIKPKGVIYFLYRVA